MNEVLFLLLGIWLGWSFSDVLPAPPPTRRDIWPFKEKVKDQSRHETANESTRR